jgi:hypothetical protein
MNTFRHTGVAPASGTTSVTGNPSGGRTEYTAGAAVQDNKLTWAGISTGGANVYAITLAPAITAYADGAIYQFKSHQANTGATPTLSVNGLAPITLVKVTAAGTIALGIGDILTGQTAMVRYAAGLGQFILLNPAGLGMTGYILVQNIQTSGVSSGETLTSGAWNTRALNTIVTDTTGLVTLASNQVTLPAGTYEIGDSFGTYYTGGADILCRGRLYNFTSASVMTVGDASGIPPSGWLTAARAWVGRGRFTLSAPAAIGIQTYPNATGGLGGVAMSLSATSEIYSTLELRKLS